MAVLTSRDIQNQKINDLYFDEAKWILRDFFAIFLGISKSLTNSLFFCIQTIHTLKIQRNCKIINTETEKKQEVKTRFMARYQRQGKDQYDFIKISIFEMK